eukprot:s2133_g1.t1
MNPSPDIKDQLQIVHADPAVILIPNLWSPEACERLIFTAKCSGAMRQSSCSGYGVAPGEAKAARTSGSVVLKPETARRYGAEALVRKLFRDLTGVLGVGGTGARAYTAEYPQVVRYERGQRFDLHQDAFAWEQAHEDGYQRHATLLVYLNTVGLGGSTRFPDLAVDVQPRCGQGLLFFPAFADGKPDERTVHAAEPAVDEKWIAQVWMGAPLPPEVQKTCCGISGLAAAVVQPEDFDGSQVVSRHDFSQADVSLVLKAHGGVPYGSM